NITVNDVGGANATIQSLANIAEGDNLSAEMSAFSAVEGELFNGTVALLTNLNLVSPAGGFAATIDWGDGTVTAGSIVGAAGAFTINGNHTYADEGAYVVQ